MSNIEPLQTGENTLLVQGVNYNWTVFGISSVEALIYCNIV